ncbi:MAG: hypothetical protein DRJ03_27895 [Chloroflexi bacterium]|nr:MAG: hypothetical protein DRJ03_27895 [Chloroflexota bacterium]
MSKFDFSLNVEAEGHVECWDRLCLSMSLRRLAVSQYGNYNFDGLVEMNGVYLAFSKDGIYALEGDDDDGEPIQALFEFMTDMGSERQKRLRSCYLGCEADGNLRLVLQNDEGNVREYTLACKPTQHSVRTAVGRSGRGRYWTFTVENVDGCYFCVDTVDAVVTVMRRKP